jgi:Uncharacterized protein conserved in bacteria
MSEPQETRHERKIEPVAIGGPGRRLRAARESRAWKQEDVAKYLNLHPRIIAALETDDYDALPPAVFVRGYLRNYAQLLDLSEEQIIGEFKHIQHIEPPPLKPRRVSRLIPSETRRWPGWMVNLTLVATIFVVMAWWLSPEGQLPWMHPSQSEDTLSGLVSLPTQDSGSQVPAETPINPAPGMPPVSGLEKAQNQSQLAAAPDHSAGVKRSAMSAQPAGTDELPHADSPDPAPNETTKAATLTAGLSAGEHAVSNAGVQTVLENAKRPSLVLRFGGEAWVDVRDASGQVLLRELAKGGSVRTITGEAPLAVVLGNAPVVEVQYGGQILDVAQHMQRGGVARFRVGEPAP